MVLHGDRPAGRQRFGAGVPALGGFEFSLALDGHGLRGSHVTLPCGHLSLGTGHGGDGLLQLSLGRIVLRIQHIHLHLRQQLTRLHKIALIHQNILHTPGQLGGDVDLRGFHASVSADKPGARSGMFKFKTKHDHYQDHGTDNGGQPPVLFQGGITRLGSRRNLGSGLCHSG